MLVRREMHAWVTGSSAKAVKFRKNDYLLMGAEVPDMEMTASLYNHVDKLLYKNEWSCDAWL
eukprot:5946098-Pleurochrysis_carterae.AAC.1